MKKTPRGMLKTLATRSIVAAIPVAMVGAYAGNMLMASPPRMAALDYHQVAEITVSPTTVGVAASPLYGQTKAQIDQQLSEMQALGVENIRVFVPWGSIDFFGPSEPGTLSWATLDLVMQSAKEHDMGVLAEVNSTPPYAVTAGFPGSGTPDPAAFAAFMTKFATKYGSTVSAYEIWNEPNAVLFSNPIDPVAYAALVKAAYQAIKPLDPTATVVAGAVGHVFTTGFTMDPVEFVQAMVAADPTIGQYFDALSYHPYDESLPFSQGNVDPNSGWFASDTAFNQLKDLVALFPTKKVWITEFGVPTYTYTDANGVVHTITQDQQEKYIADLIDNWGTSFGQNAGPIFLYTGRDPLTGSPNADDNYGLWNTLGQPKEVITQFLTQWYASHPQNPTGPTNPGNPTDPAAALAAAFQALAQQIAQAISQAFAQQLGQQIANAIVSAIANALAGLGQPQPAPATASQTLRVVSIEAPHAPSPTVEPQPEPESDSTRNDTTLVAVETTAATDATPAVVTELVVAKPVVEAVEPVSDPVVTTTSDVKEPTVTEPVDVSTPVSAPAPTAPEPASSSSSSEDPDESSATRTPKDVPAGEKSKPRKSNPVVQSPKTKGNKDVQAADAKPTAEAASNALKKTPSEDKVATG